MKKISEIISDLEKAGKKGMKWRNHTYAQLQDLHIAATEEVNQAHSDMSDAIESGRENDRMKHQKIKQAAESRAEEIKKEIDRRDEISKPKEKKPRASTSLQHLHENDVRTGFREHTAEGNYKQAARFKKELDRRAKEEEKLKGKVEYHDTQEAAEKKVAELKAKKPGHEFEVKKLGEKFFVSGGKSVKKSLDDYMVDYLKK